MIFRPIPATSAERYDKRKATIGKRKLHPHRGNSCGGNSGCKASKQRCGSDIGRHLHRCYILLSSHCITLNLLQIYIKIF